MLEPAVAWEMVTVTVTVRVKDLEWELALVPVLVSETQSAPPALRSLYSAPKMARRASRLPHCRSLK